MRAVLLSGYVTLAGCQTSPMPVASNFEYSQQYKLRSASHWNVIASDAVIKTLAMLESHHFEHPMAVFVDAPNTNTAFAQNFHDFLVTQLVQRGVKVQQDRALADIVFQYSSQTVVHQGEIPSFAPGHSTMLGAGIWALHGLRNQHMDVIMALPSALGLLGDWGRSQKAQGPTHTEMVLTTSATRNNQYLARHTDTYYIPDADTALFSSNADAGNKYAAQSIKVVGQ